MTDTPVAHSYLEPFSLWTERWVQTLDKLLGLPTLLETADRPLKLLARIGNSPRVTIYSLHHPPGFFATPFEGLGEKGVGPGGFPGFPGPGGLWGVWKVRDGMGPMKGGDQLPHRPVGYLGPLVVTVALTHDTPRRVVKRDVLSWGQEGL